MIEVSYYILFIITFLLTLLFISILLRSATKLRLIDRPNKRSMHKNPIPHGAGIGIVLSVLVVSLLKIDFYLEYWWVLLAIVVVLSVGIWDDIFHASAKLKFIFIFIATTILYLNGIEIEYLGVLAGFKLSLPLWIGSVLLFFAVAGYTNAFNLIDGLDGLSASLGIIILAAYAYIGYSYNDKLLFLLSSFFIAALLAFLIFNWNPAKIFMGDSGSLTIGFVIVLLSIVSIKYIQPVKTLYIAALPLLDTLIVMIRRKREGISISSADKSHLHHIVLRLLDNNVKKTVLLLAFVQLLFTVTGVLFFNQKEQLIGLFLFIFCFGVLYLLSTRLLRRQEKE